MIQETRILRSLRTACLSLPATTETRTFGHPTFQIRGRTFAVLDEYAGFLTLPLKVGFPMQEQLLRDQRFLKTPYVGRHGWVSLRLTGRLSWKEIRALVARSYAQVGGRVEAVTRVTRRKVSRRASTRGAR